MRQCIWFVTPSSTAHLVHSVITQHKMNYGREWAIYSGWNCGATCKLLYHLKDDARDKVTRSTCNSSTLQSEDKTDGKRDSSSVTRQRKKSNRIRTFFVTHSRLHTNRMSDVQMCWVDARYAKLMSWVPKNKENNNRAFCFVCICVRVAMTRKCGR